MKTDNKFIWVLTLCLSPAFVMAQVTEDATYPVGQQIPDNNASGLSVTVPFISTEIYQITDLEVSLDITGGFNGDYYAYLSHGTGFSVLLNRVGRDAGNAFGYPDSGFGVLFDDAAANGDVHTYRAVLNPNGGALTGTWAPDARVEDPSLTLDTSPRSAFLTAFNGLDPNGDWTLFVADLDTGGVGTLESWGLTVTGIPEPASAAYLFMLAASLLAMRLRR